MELKDIIKIAKENNCIIVKDKYEHYHIICEYMTLNNITYSSNETVFNVHQINDTIYFGAFWISQNDIKTIDFTGRKDYKIL